METTVNVNSKDIVALSDTGTTVVLPATCLPHLKIIDVSRLQRLVTSICKSASEEDVCARGFGKDFRVHILYSQME